MKTFLNVNFICTPLTMFNFATLVLEKTTLFVVYDFRLISYAITVTPQWFLHHFWLFLIFLIVIKHVLRTF